MITLETLSLSYKEKMEYAPKTIIEIESRKIPNSKNFIIESVISTFLYKL